MGKTLILAHNAEFIILNFIETCNSLSKTYLVWRFVSGCKWTPDKICISWDFSPSIMVYFGRNIYSISNVIWSMLNFMETCKLHSLFGLFSLLLFYHFYIYLHMYTLFISHPHPCPIPTTLHPGRNCSALFFSDFCWRENINNEKDILFF
jgi:hypothetical protein